MINNDIGPLISIVLPTYNGSKFIAESIQSCINQTYHNWELIVVDDKSNDNTESIVEEFIKRDKRIKLIKHEVNKKLPGALNTGFSISSGKFLTWTSDDNIYNNDALEIMLKYLQDNPHFDMVYCDVRKIDEFGNDLGLWELQGPENLVNSNCIQACFLYKREVNDTVGDYSTDMFLVEDYEYWLRVRKQFKIAHHKGFAPYRYRRHSGSLTNQRAVDVLIQMSRAQNRHLYPPEEEHKRLIDAYWNAIWYARRLNNYNIALKYALIIAKERPFRILSWRVLITTWLHFCANKLKPKGHKQLVN